MRTPRSDGYFARLAAVAGTTAQRWRPVVPSRFEPGLAIVEEGAGIGRPGAASWGEEVVDVEPPTAAIRRPATGRRPRRRPPAGDEPERTATHASVARLEGVRPDGQEVEQVVGPGRHEPDERVPIAEQRTATQPGAPTPQPVPVTVDRSAAAEPGAAAVAPAPPDTPAPHADERAERPMPPPPVATSLPARVVSTEPVVGRQQPLAAPSTSSPVVTVHIGRIDLRAAVVTPRSAAAQPAAAPLAAGPDLGDYLAERAGGL